MMGKAVGVLIPAVLVLVTATQWPDIRRYAEIRKLSMGRAGHPELVPVRGRIGYPQDSGHAQPEGTGEFDARLRGGSRSAG